MLHQIINDHLAVMFLDCLTYVATNPDEQWLVIVEDISGRTGAAYVAQMHGDTEELVFARKGKGDHLYPDEFVIRPSDEEWQRIILAQGDE